MKKPIRKKAAPKNKDVVARVQRIIAEQLKKKPGEISPGLELSKDLGADSLDALEIIMNIEEEFKMRIAEVDARKVRTVHDIITYVAQVKAK